MRCKIVESILVPCILKHIPGGGWVSKAWKYFSTGKDAYVPQFRPAPSPPPLAIACLPGTWKRAQIPITNPDQKSQSHIPSTNPEYKSRAQILITIPDLNPHKNPNNKSRVQIPSTNPEVPRHSHVSGKELVGKLAGHPSPQLRVLYLHHLLLLHCQPRVLLLYQDTQSGEGGRRTAILVNYLSRSVQKQNSCGLNCRLSVRLTQNLEHSIITETYFSERNWRKR